MVIPALVSGVFLRNGGFRLLAPQRLGALGKRNGERQRRFMQPISAWYLRRARCDWLAMTSCCSSGWGQCLRERLLERQRGRSDDGDRRSCGRYGSQAATKGISSLFPDIFSCPCARWGPWLGLCGTLGRWRGWGNTISPVTFVTASGQDGAGSLWGAGGEARPPPPQRMWPGCIPVGFGSDPGWGGGDWCGRRWRPEEEEMTERALPPPYGLTAAAPGGKPPVGHSL